MDDHLEPVPDDQDLGDGEHLVASLRQELRRALKARESDAVSALRIAIAGIENEQAVAPPASSAPASSEHFARANRGVGSTEVNRRRLSHDEVVHLLTAQINELRMHAAHYDELGQGDAGARLRHQADVLVRHLP